MKLFKYSNRNEGRMINLQLVFALMHHHLESVGQYLGGAEPVGGTAGLQDQGEVWNDQGHGAEEQLDVGRDVTMATGLIVDGDEEGDVFAQVDLA